MGKDKLEMWRKAMSFSKVLKDARHIFDHEEQDMLDHTRYFSTGSTGIRQIDMGTSRI